MASSFRGGPRLGLTSDLLADPGRLALFESFITIADQHWFWSGPATIGGSGAVQLSINFPLALRDIPSASYSARRLAWLHWRGPLVGTDKVYPNCPEPYCVNPDCLRVTHKGICTVCDRRRNIDCICSPARVNNRQRMLTYYAKVWERHRP